MLTEFTVSTVDPTTFGTEVRRICCLFTSSYKFAAAFLTLLIDNLASSSLSMETTVSTTPPFKVVLELGSFSCVSAAIAPVHVAKSDANRNAAAAWRDREFLLECER